MARSTSVRPGSRDPIVLFVGERTLERPDVLFDLGRRPGADDRDGRDAIDCSRPPDGHLCRTRVRLACDLETLPVVARRPLADGPFAVSPA